MAIKDVLVSPERLAAYQKICPCLHVLPIFHVLGSDQCKTMYLLLGNGNKGEVVCVCM